MRDLGNSVKLRYLEIIGDKVDFPKDIYQGDYIKDIAMQLFIKYGDKLREEEPGKEYFNKYGSARNIF